jgi:hypothetical protein
MLFLLEVEKVWGLGKGSSTIIVRDITQASTNDNRHIDPCMQDHGVHGVWREKRSFMRGWTLFGRS